MVAPRWPLCWPLCWALAALAGAAHSCPTDQLVTYRLDIETHWSQQRFPKQYPIWRPPAQFSKFFGMSHNGSRVLFRAGELASEAVRLFAEQGSSAGLDQLAQGQPGVLDQFTAPPVTQGVGTSHARVFIDGAHSQLSLISKIVPSPDWFIGIDSVDMCDQGRWIDSLDIKLYPMDAGTDQGMTFTAPNWESAPHEPVCAITSRKPSHPAGSFFYPDRPELPALATLRLARVRSYTLSEELDRRDTVTYSVDTLDPSRAVSTSQTSLGRSGIHVLVTSGNHSAASQRDEPRWTTTTETSARWRDHRAKSTQVALPVPQETKKMAPPPRLNDVARWPSSKAKELSSSHRSSWSGHGAGSRGAAPRAADAQAAREALRSGGELARAAVRSDGSVARVALRPDGSVARVAVRPDGPPVQLGGLRVWAVNSDRAVNGAGARRTEGAKVPAGDRQAIIRRIADHYRKRNGRRHHRRRRRRRKRIPRDCVVGEWEPWGPCSRNCGIGEMTRSRPVKQHARRGGRPCPSLQERRWCGSARACTRKRYFRW